MRQRPRRSQRPYRWIYLDKIMKPRTKIEKRVAELSATLHPLRDKDFDWMLADYQKTYKGKGLSYYLVLERCKEFQVIRYYYLKTFRKRTNEYRFFEFARIFMNKEHRVVLAKDRNMRVDGWIEWTEMSVKHWFNVKYDYSYLGGVDRIGWSGVIVRSVLPELRLRGLKTSCHGISPYKICFSLLNDNRIETLFKLKQYRLVGYLCWNAHNFDNDLWQSIRVALRHGYHWDNRQELRDWIDMLGDLKHLGLDTRNPHYICPAVLSEAHQHWIDVRHKIAEKEREERDREIAIEQMQRAIEVDQIYREKRKCFDGMLISDGEINISVIPTPKDMVEEGRAMHHCVGGYTERWDSLILSARIDGNRIETVEVDLTTFEVEQSRGVCNRSTEYHDRIVALMESNMGEIKKRYNKQLKAA